MAAPSYHFWLRAEVKPNEFRTLILPEGVKALIEAGHSVTVERSADRCVPDDEFVKAGATLAEGGSWINAPLDALICGLKELPESSEPLKHRHIYFAHCYKGQGGANELMTRWIQGGGRLWDLEFLMNDQGRRVAAFGRSAGSVGMALGYWMWANKVLGHATPLEPMTKPYIDYKALAVDVSKALDAAVAKFGRFPRVIVIGALGRCGQGALEFSTLVNAPSDSISKWDLEETRPGGPFHQILEHDIMLNCIYLSSPIPPFITRELIEQTPSRNLTSIVDVSCDASNPHNPIPLYNTTTTFTDPTIRVLGGEKAVDIIAIDHLPSLVPLESSREFAGLMLPHMIDFNQTPVWHRASALFDEKTAPLRAQ